ncbi:hypothetical protein AB0I28_12580 [Phytomonospora sp. NPDC050363]|uniref:hypothetical protein n=1 Tax=Phytomonospora sp. NPDC050363 TaxID=3155642 RepID=UPI0033F9A782
MFKHHWFDLGRHDDDETPPVEEPEEIETPPEEPEEEAKPKPSETVDYWKRRARENERRAKDNADKAKRLDDIEAANQTESEKLEAARDAAEKRAEQALTRAVTAEVKALASGSFADPSDAAEFLGRDTSKFLSADGDVDTDAIGDALADLLERKPHWAKPTVEAPKPKTPRPDPSQGPRGEDKPVDFRTADSAELKAELDKFGVRLR